jgi:hypothetical protein
MPIVPSPVTISALKYQAVMRNPRSYIAEPTEQDVLCRNCGHPLRDHSLDETACEAETDEESGALCECTMYQEWDSQPVEVYIPPDATLEDLMAIRKAACADGRMVPRVLNELIQNKCDALSSFEAPSIFKKL